MSVELVIPPPPPPPKTLVIGSTGHAHVTCVQWKDLAKMNLVDYENVVINVRSLNESILKGLKFNFFDRIRTDLSRLLDSRGQLVVLGDERINVRISQHAVHSNYSWSPITIGTKQESGTTVKIRGQQFAKFLCLLKEWQYYYFIPQASLTTELTQVCGGTHICRYKNNIEPLAVSRYDRLLAFSMTFDIFAVKDDIYIQTLGKMTFLPVIGGLEERDAVRIVLEELLGVAQITLPPAWVDTVPIPLATDVQKEIDDKETQIATLNNSIAELENEKQKIEKYKTLLYASGHELEDIFADCLARMGGKVTPAKYSEEEFILEVKGGIYLVECKGVGNSIALTHVRQLTDYMLKFEEDEGKAGKGILLGNAWKDIPIEQRTGNEHIFFPDNVVNRAQKLDICLLSSVDFYFAFCKFLAGEIVGEVILDQIVNTIGVVILPK